MRVQGHRTGHAPYIAAACRAIETRGILVADVRTTASSGGRRAATLALRPDEAAFTEQVPAEASAAWDEEDGWSLAVGGAPEASRVHKGLGVVPDPEDVAAWIEVLLAHPELIWASACLMGYVTGTLMTIWWFRSWPGDGFSGPPLVTSTVTCRAS